MHIHYSILNTLSFCRNVTDCLQLMHCGEDPLTDREKVKYELLLQIPL